MAYFHDHQHRVIFRCEDAPNVSGIYHLVLHLPEDKRARIGALGTFSFPAGYYVYTGSAKRGLRARLRRHWRRNKRLWWHIDYLRQHAHVVCAILHVNLQMDECNWHECVSKVLNARTVVHGFGSSDCNCESHLCYIDDFEPEAIGRLLTVKP